MQNDHAGPTHERAIRIDMTTQNATFKGSEVDLLAYPTFAALRVRVPGAVFIAHLTTWRIGVYGFPIVEDSTEFTQIEWYTVDRHGREIFRGYLGPESRARLEQPLRNALELAKREMFDRRNHNQRVS